MYHSTLYQISATLENYNFPSLAFYRLGRHYSMCVCVHYTLNMNVSDKGRANLSVDDWDPFHDLVSAW